jgi:hypothetical protein
MDSKIEIIKRNNRSHYKVINNELIPKRTFINEKQACLEALRINTLEKTIHKMVAYKCIICGNFHLGSTSKILTPEDKVKNLKKYNQIKTYRL